MIKTSTNYDLVKELYNENNVDVSDSLAMSMLVDKSLADEYSEFKELSRLLDKIQYAPSKMASIRLMTTIKQVL